MEEQNENRGRITMDTRLVIDRFPRASGYNPEWVLALAWA
jgi:hypothetical protein